MNKSNKNRIKEIVVVEGRDDTAAIKRSVDALTIETHGYGIRQETWDLIAKAYETVGIIVFTDLIYNNRISFRCVPSRRQRRSSQ